MYSRVDLQQYYAACKSILNMFVFPQGGATRRPGTKYLGPTKYSDKKAILIPFIFSTEQAYVLEFGDLYFRVWANGGLVFDGTETITNGSFTSAGTGWTEVIGTYSTISYAGGDKVTLESKPPITQTLSSAAVLSQTYTPIVAAETLYISFNILSNSTIPRTPGSPGIEFIYNQVRIYYYDSLDAQISYEDLWLDVYPTFNTSGVFNVSSITPTGAVKYKLEITSSSTYGGESKIEVTDISIKRSTGGSFVDETTPYTETTVNQLQFCQSADELYLALPTYKPNKVVRSSDVDWEISDITFTSPPATWTYLNGPRAVSFFEQRLCWAGPPDAPRTIYCSKSGDFFNLTTGTEADDAIIAILTDNEVNALRWLYPRNTLLVGSSSGVGSFGSNTNYDPITPTNIKYNPESSDRSGNLPPKRVGNSIIASDLYSKHMVAINYNENLEMVTENLMILAEHLTADTTIIDYAFQQVPYHILWCVLSDGTMVAVTMLQTEGVLAWTRHETDGRFESICVIPSSSGAGDDELWCIVARDLPSGTTRSVEYFTQQFDVNTSTPLANKVFLDSSITTTFESPVTVISGIDHLEGLEVYVLADGLTQGPFTVSSGSITLTTAASIVTVGLAYSSEVEPINYNGGGVFGTAEGRLKKISEITLQLYKTGEFEAGTSTKQYTHQKDLPPFTGPFRIADWPGDWGMETNVKITQSKPLPLTVLSIIPTMVTQER